MMHRRLGVAWERTVERRGECCPVLTRALGGAPGREWLLAATIARRYSEQPQVEAVALGGSAASGVADEGSDIDLYVYLNAPLSMEARTAVACEGATYLELDNRFWEPGDEWIDGASDIHVDVMFRDVGWIQDQLTGVLRRFQASVGYSTCLWHNVLSSAVLFDRAGWFALLQEEARQPYPEALRRAIVERNHPILRGTASSYLYQLTRAVAREDWVSVNHRIAAALASYFDILFAVNRMPHPGEKRLLSLATTRCPQVPEGMGRAVEAVLVSSHSADILAKFETLVDGLDALLRTEALIA
jgi:hypothetical protein